jgi:hypothetical protein
MSPSIDCHRALFAQPALASACGQCEWSVLRRVGCRSPTLVDACRTTAHRACTKTARVDQRRRDQIAVDQVRAGEIVIVRQPEHSSVPDILTPRGPVDRRLARVRWPLADATFARRSRNLGEVFAEPQRILIGGRRVSVSMRWRSGREHQGLNDDNRRNTELSNKTVCVANKERSGFECRSTEVIDRLRHVREMPDERTAWQNS